MSETDYDTIVIGAGSGGNACAYALAAAGQRVAVIERERVGGECAYWACVPSKVLLRSAHPNAQSATTPGSREARAGAPHFPAAAAWRTDMVDSYRDDDHARELREAGATLIRGDARVLGPGHVRVNATEYRAQSLVIATGSENDEPHIEGLAGRPYWTSRDATSAGEVPQALIILGGGAVGIELAQIFARYGSSVTLVESSPQLLSDDDPDGAAYIARALEHDGVSVRTGASATSVRYDASSVHLSIEGSSEIVGTQLCVAVGRRPRTQDFGLESLGVTFDAKGAIEIDERCMAAPRTYAIGDVTGVGMFTHVAKYQARIAAATILGKTARASYDAIPRCVYTAPEFASVGMTRERAASEGRDLVVSFVDFSEITRPTIDSDPPVTGAISLFADAASLQLVGGWMIGPSASETIGFIGAAIRARTPLETLLDTILPYPTYSEGLYVALDRIAHKAQAIA